MTYFVRTTSGALLNANSIVKIVYDRSEGDWEVWLSPAWNDGTTRYRINQDTVRHLMRACAIPED